MAWGLGSWRGGWGRPRAPSFEEADDSADGPYPLGFTSLMFLGAAGVDYGYSSLAENGYMRNPVAHRCIDLIARGAAGVPFDVLGRDKDVLESHPLGDLLERPNPDRSRHEFVNQLMGHLMVGGNAYVRPIGGSVTKRPTELHLLRPDRVEVRGKGGVFPDEYVYRVGSRVERFPVNQVDGTSEIKHIRLFHPTSDYLGASPMEAAMVAIEQHNQLMEHNIALLQNGARPSGALVFKPVNSDGRTLRLDDEQRKQIMEAFERKVSGPDNAGRPMLLAGDFEWKSMGLSPVDMDFLKLLHTAATNIGMAFGVPAQLLGVPDNQTYSNVHQARLALYEETIIPHLRKVEADLNEFLGPMFGDGARINFSLDKLPALAERQRMNVQNVASAVMNGIMTRNEARSLLGFRRYEGAGADELMVPSNLFPIDGEESPDEPDASAYEEADDQAGGG